MAVPLGEDDVVTGGEVSLDHQRHEVTIRGEETRLPLKEFELLALLLENAGRVLTRDTLIDRVWGSDYVGDTKTLDVHVKRVAVEGRARPGQPDAHRHHPGPRLQVRGAAPLIGAGSAVAPRS